MGNTNYGGRIGFWWSQRSHHDFVSHVLCWRSEWSHASHSIAHQRQQIHADSVACVSRKVKADRIDGLIHFCFYSAYCR